MATIIGTSIGDSLAGGSSDDDIHGLEGDDSLDGGGGNDFLDGGQGADTMTGGTGDDIYVVDDQGDAVVESAGEGADEVRTGLAYYVLPDHVEALTGFSADYQELVGNALDNVITGGNGWTSLSGGDGDDTLVHSGGGDTAFGDSGYDTYVLPGGEADYAITLDEWGIRIRDLADDTDTYLFGVEAIRFAADSLTVTVDALFNRYGTAGDDVLEGNDSDNLIYGYGGDDLLTGYGGRDVLDGGAGADTMIGGDGSDDYYVDNAGDIVVEAADGGFDRVFVSVAQYTVGAEVELLATLLNVDSVLIGGSTNNFITGGAGDDRLEGGGGDDELDGGAGSDTMIGGAGDDFYFVDDPADVVTESVGGGIDTVSTTLLAYTLPANVENLFGYSGDVSFQGNSLNNVIGVGHGAVTVSGGAGSDTLSYWAETEAVLVDLGIWELGGGAADDTLTSIENLTGSSYDDVLRGTGTINVLDGGEGADTLVGRNGSDIYYVDNEGDLVVEVAGGGTDEVRIRYLESYTLPDYVEKLTNVTDFPFTGIGNALANEIKGNADVDHLYGAAGNDILNGGGGDDWLYGQDGHDTLNGGAGADTMAGGLNNDSYFVDNVGDVVTEQMNEGIDQVTVTLAAYTLTAYVENLTFAGTGDFAGTGNGLGNIILGQSGADTLNGAGGGDELRGGAGNDVLSGGDGDDVLFGGAGADLLTGGGGGDVFRFAAGETGTGAAADRIADFAQFFDKVDLRDIDANAGTAGDQAFSFIGTAAFSGVAGQLRYMFDGTDTRLQGDCDGDAVADFELVFSGDVPLVSSDFYL
ncbi:MAG TPA: calcium-binding protein [Allosphingosinicella sp.]|nr:calcium-binding protein [Allosphingosinicella sp.]